MAIEKVQVVGAGQMGSGIAQVAAQAGLTVHLADVEQEMVEQGLEAIKKHLSRSVEKERISQEEMDETLARIESGTEYASDADLAIEAVPETIEEKQPLTLVQTQMTVQELVEKAERLGFKQADVVTGARVYHNQPNIYRLSPEQVADLDRRMTARAERVKMAQPSAEEEKPAARAQAARNLKRA